MKERRTDDYQIQIVHTLTKCRFVEEGIFGREFGRKPNRTYLMNLITSPGTPHLRKDCSRISRLKPTAQFTSKSLPGTIFKK